VSGAETNDPKKIRERALALLAKDYFGALDISRSATPEEVKKAFFEAAKTWHPDRAPSGSEELKRLYAKVFARLDLARSTLVDGAQRARYIDGLEKAIAMAADATLAEAALELKKSDAMLKKNDRLQAAQHLERAVKLAPANVEYKAALISLQVKPSSTREELKLALTTLDELIARDDSCERALVTRGQVRKRLDMHKEAFADFNRVSTLNPNNIDAAREVRLFKMRNESPQQKAERQKEEVKEAEGSGGGGGVGGFFKKLFKR
jgi:curved DNA-binding protein CbpA